MIRVFITVLAVMSVGVDASAQQRQGPPPLTGLRAKIRELFIFGTGETPLVVRDAAGRRNLAFVPSAGASLIDFLENAIATNVGNIPFSSANSGFTVSFEDGAPVLTREAPGPIFAERASTLGAGRVLVGSSLTVFNFTSIRGTPLDRLRLNFAHVNFDRPGCDSIAGGDCSVYGIPLPENDFMQFDLDLDLQVRALSFVFAYGLLERVDIGVAIPIVFTSVRGASQGQIVPFGGPPAANFFEGTPEDPVLISDRKFVEGSASGVGDVTARVKIAVTESPSASLALLAEARFATGSEDDLLGSGAFAARGMAIASTRFDSFSPHLNIGYLHRSDSLQNNFMLVTTGFDQVLASWATLAVDLVSQFQIGATNLQFPQPAVLEFPFERVIEPTIIRDRRDDIIDGSIGFKFVTPSGLTLIGNSLWPLNKGGVRSNVVLTVGIEYTF